MVVANKISHVEGIATSNGGIFIGDSVATDPSLNIVIQGNSISDIHSVNRGAYAIHVNNGNGSTANTGLRIRNNTANNLAGGGWAHAIGLEANTPFVLVTGNSISNVVSPTSNRIAVWFERENTSFVTGQVHNNNLNVTNADYGIAVDPALSSTSTSSVSGTCNWWGDSNGPGPIGPSATGALVTPNVDFTPWLTAPAPGEGCGCRKGDGDGDFEDNDGHSHHAHFHHDSCEDGGGDVEEDDRDSGKHFESTSVNSATFTSDANSQALTMIGTGLHDGLPVGFTMIAVDHGNLGAPGIFTLILTDGYSTTGSLPIGAIVID
jgi:hypothetical protein